MILQKSIAVDLDNGKYVVMATLALLQFLLLYNKCAYVNATFRKAKQAPLFLVKAFDALIAISI